jgi:hypothetical protein
MIVFSSLWLIAEYECSERTQDMSCDFLKTR